MDTIAAAELLGLTAEQILGVLVLVVIVVLAVSVLRARL
jgi:hypothetical protein